MSAGSGTTVARSLGVYYLQLAVNGAALVVVTPLLIGGLGQAAYGVYVVLDSILGYSTLLDFGLTTAVAKYTAEYRATSRTNRISQILSSTFAVLAGGAAAMLAAALLFTPFLASAFDVPAAMTTQAIGGFLLLAVASVVLLLASVLGNVIYGLERVDVVKGISIVYTVANAALLLVLLRMEAGLVGVGVASLASATLLFGMYAWFLRRSASGIVVRPALVHTATIREIAPYSARTFLLRISARVLYQTDVILIGLVLGAAAVGPYAVAYRVCFLITMVFSVLSTTMFPRFSALFAQGDMTELQSLLLALTRVSVAIMTPIGIALALYGQTYLAAWVGRDNVVAFPVLFALIAMDFIHAVGTPAGLVLQGIGRNERFVYSELVNAALNAALSLVLLYQIGLIGAVLGTLIAHLLTSSWVVPLLACRHVGLPAWTFLRSGAAVPMLIGIPTALIAWYVIEVLFPSSALTAITAKSAAIAGIYAALYAGFACSAAEWELYRSILWRQRRADAPVPVATT